MTTPTKVTKEALQAKIGSIDYVVMPDGRTTVCQLTMQNGFTVRGESSCVSVENFNKALGEKYAYEKAFDAAWAFEGYLLAELRHREARGDALLRRVTAIREAHTVVGSFGWVLDRLNEGSRVARAGWNGKGMWVCHINPGNAVFKGLDMQPCIGMKTVDSKMQPGWVPSQQDMLALDWEEVL